MTRTNAWSPWRAVLVLSVTACSGAGAVEYVNGKCLIRGVVSTLPQVEARQAELTQHILSRQPILTGIAVAAVVIAGASYAQRLFSVLAARRASATTFAERLRARMERYSAHPVRYFSILGGMLAILLAAGTAYIQLDADKRTSERALTTLQFCHLALRTADEQRVLTQQRDNLAAIQSTAGDIRVLVDKLPPAEQQKAHEIVNSLTASLGQQRALVTRYAAQADESTRAVQERQADVERGLSKLDGDVGTLKAVPDQLGRIDGALHDVGARSDDLAGKVDSNGDHLETIERIVTDLAARPAPVCNCAPPPIASAPAPAEAHAGSAHVTATPAKTSGSHVAAPAVAAPPDPPAKGSAAPAAPAVPSAPSGPPTPASSSP